MRIGKLTALAAVLFLILLCTNSAFSADENIMKGPPIPGVNADPEVQWVWGEVSLVDPLNKKINIRYLDYETDTEKELTIGVDAVTRFDNLASLEQLKPGDPISVDYVISSGGGNLAKNISIEKPEESVPAALNEENPLNGQGAVAPSLEVMPALPPETQQMPVSVGMEQLPVTEQPLTPEAPPVTEQKTN